MNINSKFFFRINSNEKMGIGHIMRCLRLARELKKRGFKSFFCLDRLNFNNLIKNDFEVIELYRDSFYKNELSDANNFLNKIKIKNQNVIVDDYRLGSLWQRTVAKKNNKIIVIDDFEQKKNFCDVYINYKPNLIKNNLSDKLFLKSNCLKLLGPKYSVLDCKKIITKNKKFKIGFYFGGSGDFKIVTNIIKELFLLKYLNQDFHELVIIKGLYSSGLDELTKLSKKYKIIKILKPQSNIDNISGSLDLLISSAGNIVYETSFYNIPTLLFEVSNNQSNKYEFMEKIGHYFILPKKDLKKSQKIANLIYLFIKNIKRIKKLHINKEVKVDNLGKSRIIDNILNDKKILFNNQKQRYSGNDKYNDKYKVLKVGDNYVNQYLNYRNLNINRSVSTNFKKINFLDHYLWWLNNKRNSFALYKKKEIRLFFYDEFINLNKKKYSLQGWFSACKDLQLSEVLYALKYQKKMMENKEIKLSLGIINKNNKINLSKYLGWKMLDNQSDEAIHLKKYYKVDSNYYFYIR